MKWIYFVMFVFVTTSLFSCKSKEEKAADLIKEELNKTLYDFESYQPIETIVKEAKLSVHNDSACILQGTIIYASLKLANEYFEKISDARDHMEIWGAPTSYSSTYSDRQYYKYKNERDEYFEKSKTVVDLIKKSVKELKDLASKLDTTQVIGWDVSHRFRCKTKGGNSTIGDYHYLLDKDFKKSLRVEDNDDDDIKAVHDAIDSVLDGKLDDVSL